MKKNQRSHVFLQSRWYAEFHLRIPSKKSLIILIGEFLKQIFSLENPQTAMIR